MFDTAIHVARNPALPAVASSRFVATGARRSNGLANLVKAAGLAGLFLASGCATVISGDETDTQITSDPSGAECELTGDDYNTIVRTPANVELDSDAAPVMIVCRMDGHREAAEEIDTSMDGSIFGNILLGGIIGVVVDAAAGSGMKYPDSVDLVLKPESFDSVAALDAWYERQRQRIDAKYDALLAEVPQRCTRGRSGVSADHSSINTCDEEATAEIERLRQAELDALSIERAAEPLPAA